MVMWFQLDGKEKFGRKEVFIVHVLTCVIALEDHWPRDTRTISVAFNGRTS